MEFEIARLYASTMNIGWQPLKTLGGLTPRVIEDDRSKKREFEAEAELEWRKKGKHTQVRIAPRDGVISYMFTAALDTDQMAILSRESTVTYTKAELQIVGKKMISRMHRAGWKNISIEF